jgi:transcriptional regulator NrdR family protein
MRFNVEQEEPQHVEQVMLYGYFCDLRPVKTVAVLYYNPETGQEWFFEQCYDPEVGNKLRKKFDALLEAVATSTEPEKKYSEPARECEWCSLKYSCFSPKELYEKFEKSKEVALIDETMESELVSAVREEAVLKERIADMKDKLEFALSGKAGKGKEMKATYVAMSVTKTLDKDALAKDIDLSKYEKESYRSGYYKYTFKKGDGNE